MKQDFILPTKDRALLIARISRFLAEAMIGKRLRVTVQLFVKERTTPQCRWLNGVAYKMLGEITGYERDDISEYCCGRYWGWTTVKCPKTPNNPEGVKDVPIRTTTTDESGKRCVMSTLEFNDYKDFIQRFGARLGISIPDPNEDIAESETSD